MAASASVRAVCRLGYVGNVIAGCRTWANFLGTDANIPLEKSAIGERANSNRLPISAVLDKGDTVGDR